MNLSIGYFTLLSFALATVISVAASDVNESHGAGSAIKIKPVIEGGRRVQSSTKSPTKSPTKNPTKSPTKSPTNSPTKNPTGSPTSSATCNDSPLRFKVWIRGNNGSGNKGKLVTRSCAWVASSTSDRCALNGASMTCPATCGTCGTCKNSPLKFNLFSHARVLEKNGGGGNFGGDSEGWQNCWWIAKRASKRCLISGVSDTCRDTCGTC